MHMSLAVKAEVPEHEGYLQVESCKIRAVRIYYNKRRPCFESWRQGDSWESQVKIEENGKMNIYKLP